MIFQLYIWQIEEARTKCVYRMFSKVQYFTNLIRLLYVPFTFSCVISGRELRVVRAALLKARCRWNDSRWRHIFSFWIFCLLPVSHCLAKPIQMKSSIKLIKSNGYKEINLILNKYGDGLYDDLSALRTPSSGIKVGKWQILFQLNK